jgi:hypothetical protein
MIQIGMTGFRTGINSYHLHLYLYLGLHRRLDLTVPPHIPIDQIDDSHWMKNCAMLLNFKKIIMLMMTKMTFWQALGPEVIA